MARGQILTIPTSTAVLVTTLSREQKASVSILNPNDGICYVKMNGPASNSVASWDWKIPSQSYCQLPGPWESLGVYYLDQSGSGRTAEVNVYELDSQISVPSFLAIGRAVQAAGSTVDISQGTQPSNPPASSVRLWADGSGDLHFLESTGTDNTLIDSSNYNAMITMTGDVIGPLNNTIVQIRNTSLIYAFDTGGIRRNHVSFGSETLWWAGVGGGFRWVNASNSVQWMALDTNGSLAVAGNATLGGGLVLPGGATVSSNASYIYLNSASGVVNMQGFYYFSNNSSVYLNWNGSYINTLNSFVTGDRLFAGSYANIGAPGDISANRGNGTGVYYLGGNPSCYLFYNGTQYVFGAVGYGVKADSFSTGAQFAGGWPIAGDFNVARAGNTTGYIFFANTGHYIGYDGTNFVIFGANLVLQQNIVYFGNGISNINWNGTYFNISHSMQFNTVGNQIVWPNGSYISGNAGYVQGSQRALKNGIVTLKDSDLLNKVSDPSLPVSSYYWEGETKPNVGFIADDIAKVLPNNIVRNENGEPNGYNPQELTAILWGAVRELSKKVTTLEGAT